MDLPAVLAIDPLERPPDTTVVVPGSKSITNRALLCAGLARGRSTLDGALAADDTAAMIGAVEALGGRFRPGPDQQVVVEGGGGVPGEGISAPIDARMSGTTARFVTPVVASGSASAVVDGHPQLRDRPMADLVGALRRLGVTVEALGSEGHLPLRVRGPFTADTVELPGDVSSQFVSGLMLAAPLTAAGLTIVVRPPVVSRPYIEMTASVMASFGAPVGGRGDSTWVIGAGGYSAVECYDVEPDASTASYFLAAAAMTGGRVRIEGLGRLSIQGDVAFAELLAAMGAQVTIDDRSIEVRGGELRGIEADLSEISDTAPTLAVVAARADGPTTVSGIGFIRGKESDRIAATVAELERCGVPAEELPDGFAVRPGGPPTPARVRTYDDHRMAMAFALLGLVVPGIEIDDPACVAKTFPAYFEALGQLR